MPSSLGKMARPVRIYSISADRMLCQPSGRFADLLSAGREGVCRQIFHGDEPGYKLQPDGRMVHGTGETIDINSVDASKVNRKTLENFLKQGTVGEASGFVEEYFQNVGEKNCQSFMFRQYIVMDCYLCVHLSGTAGTGHGTPSGQVADMEMVMKERLPLTC